MKELNPLLWCIPTVLLVIAFFDMPYGFYTLLRIIVFGSLAYIAYQHHETGLQTWFIPVLIILAITYNPIILIHFEKEVWTGVNTLTIMVILFNFVKTRRG